MGSSGDEKTVITLHPAQAESSEGHPPAVGGSTEERAGRRASRKLNMSLHLHVAKSENQGGGGSHHCSSEQSSQDGAAHPGGGRCVGATHPVLRAVLGTRGEAGGQGNAGGLGQRCRVGAMLVGAGE